MSDPVTQAEIEDVLSSIRRLVSEDGRTAPRPQPVQTPPKAASRLVLTPALRVSDPEPNSPKDCAETSPTLPTPTASNERSSDASHADDSDKGRGGQSEMKVAFEQNDLVHTPEFHHIAPVRTAESANLPQARSETLDTLTVDSGVDGFENDCAAEDHGAGEAAADNQETSVSEAGALDAAPWHDPDATLFHAAAAGDQGDIGEDAAGDFPSDAPHETQDLLEQEAAAGARVSAVVQKIAELEAKVARSEEQWEPDGRSQDPYAGTNIETLEWKDHLEGVTGDSSEAGSPARGDEEKDPDQNQTDMKAQATSSGRGGDAPDLAADAVTEATMERLEELSAEDSFLDEDSLRDLVAEIVRSELQGALGERITRNVRKLVRREIHRALAAQDLA